MSTAATSIAGLSPEQKRALLSELLRKRIEQPDTLPLAFAQERLWFLHQMDPDSAAYHVWGAVNLQGSLCPAVLEACLREILRRHESLRAVFMAKSGKPTLAIAPDVELHLRVVDFEALPEELRRSPALSAITRIARQPFDLSRPPMLRACLVRLAETDSMVVLVMPHIVSDEWSLGVLIREIATLYQTISDARPSPLAELPIGYTDYVRWQRKWMQGRVLDDQLGYWKRQLAGATEPLELPFDRPRPPVQSFRGSGHPIAYAKTLRERLTALGQCHGASLFMVLCAGFQILLHRLCGVDAISVGTPISNRNRAELEGLIGLLVNTLVLRLDLSGRPNVRESLDRVRKVILGAYDHQELPFERLVDELEPERHLSHTPLFQVVLTLQNAPVRKVELPRLTLKPLGEIRRVTAKFDVSLMFEETERGLAGTAIYRTALFDRTTLQRMLEQLHVLLESMVDHPERRISELVCLTAAERHQLLREWNDPRLEYAGRGLVHHLVESQVDRRRDAVAVVSENRRLSYGELNRQANRLAHHLRRLGVGAEVLVGIAIERTPKMVVGLLGILKAGGAYVPLDPSYPRERLAFMLADADIGVLLTQDHCLHHLPPFEGDVICIDAEVIEPAAAPQANPRSGVRPQNPIYLIYTSGSTGRPKGVVVEHRNVINRLQFSRQVDLGVSDRYLQKASISFDVSVLEIFLPLVVGAQCVLARQDSEQDVDLVDTIVRHQITYTSMTPTLIQALLKSGRLSACTSLRQVASGGEAISATLPAQFSATLEAQLHNRYGPTETTIAVLSEHCKNDAPRHNVPIGRPIAKARAYVLDRQLHPLPAGARGELHIGGVCLVRGYFARPARTAEVFVPDSLSRRFGSRLYKTADLVRQRPAGEIEYLGRIDHQVKMRGFRIELGEIEAALTRHVEVSEAAAAVHEDHNGSKRLLAYVVLRDGASLEDHQLRSFVQQALPGYMVPSAFLTLSSLPRNTSGKINPNDLPLPDPSHSQGNPTPPRTETERAITDVLREVLHLKRVGIDDNFFHLGGNSLLAIQFVERLRKEVDPSISFTSLFTQPTVRDLAQSISKQLDNSPRPRTARRGQKRRERLKQRRNSRKTLK